MPATHLIVWSKIVADMILWWDLIVIFEFWRFYHYLPVACVMGREDKKKYGFCSCSIVCSLCEMYVLVLLCSHFVHVPRINRILSIVRRRWYKKKNKKNNEGDGCVRRVSCVPSDEPRCDIVYYIIIPENRIGKDGNTFTRLFSW